MCKKSAVAICMVQLCGNRAAVRGVCMQCLRQIQEHIKNGDVTDQDCVDAGLWKPAFSVKHNGIFTIKMAVERIKENRNTPAT